MRRAIFAVPAAAARASCAPARAAENPLLPAPAIPPALQALETKADALQITSARVSLSTSLRLGTPFRRSRANSRGCSNQDRRRRNHLAARRGVDRDAVRLHVRLRYVGGHATCSPGISAGTTAAARGSSSGMARSGASSGPSARSPRNGMLRRERYASFSRSSTTASASTSWRRPRSTASPSTGFEEEVEPKAGGGSTGPGRRARRLRRGPAPASAATRPKARLSVYFAASGAMVRVAGRRPATGNAGATVTARLPGDRLPVHDPGAAALARDHRTRSAEALLRHTTRRSRADRKSSRAHDPGGPKVSSSAAHFHLSG